jgi:hypothetical protein
VDWTTNEPDHAHLAAHLGTDLAEVVTDIEEHHDDATHAVRGRVTEIHAVYSTARSSVLELRQHTRAPERIAFVGFLVAVDDSSA